MKHHLHLLPPACRRPHFISAWLGVGLLLATLVVPLRSQALAFVSYNDTVVGTGLNQFNYSGTWFTDTNTAPQAYMANNHHTNDTNAAYTFKFNGTQVKVYSEKNNTLTLESFSVDGGAEKLVDPYSPVRQDQQLLYTSAVLPAGLHTLRVSNTSYWSPGAIGSYFVADRVDVMPSPVVPGTDPTSAQTSTAAANNTGSTIADTNYAVPSGAIFMATTGKDTNTGTEAAPVLTLAKALALAPAGGTVVMRQGTYSQATVQPSKKFTLQPYPHEKVWFDGSVVATPSWWRAEGGNRWSMAWSTPNFCSNKYYNLPFRGQTSPTCSWGTAGGGSDYGDAQNPMATDPQMVFQDGMYLKEASALSEVTPGSNKFFYAVDAAHKTGRIYIATNPAGHTMDVTKYTTVLQIQNQNAAGSTIRGIGFRRFATDIYSGNATHGVLLLGVPGMTIENNTFTKMAGTGIMLTNPQNGVVRGNTFVGNGFDGLEATGHSTTSASTVDNLLVENNVFTGNNAERFGCGYACGIANMKYNHMNGSTVRNNLFQSGVAGAKGFWADENCNHMTIVNNVMRNNEGPGLFYEVSDTGVIASNLVYGNGRGMDIGAANTKIYNNSVVNNGSGVIVYDDGRVPTGGKYGPNTANDIFINNIISSTNATTDRCGRRALFDACNGGGQTNALQYFPSGGSTDFDYNVYVRTATGPSALAIWQTSAVRTYNSLSAFHGATLKDSHGKEVPVASSGGVFVNAAAGNYNVQDGTAAKGSCSALPTAIAAAVGVAGGRAVDCGALRYYPNGAL